MFADTDLLAMYSDYAHQEKRRRAAVRAAEEDRLLRYSQTVCKQTAQVPQVGARWVGARMVRALLCLSFFLHVHVG